MCFLPKAAVKSGTTDGGLDTDCFISVLEARKSKIKMSTGMCSLWGLQREDPSLPLLVLSSG